MYPETDVPPVTPDLSEIVEPELLTERAHRYETDLGLDEGLAEQVAFGRRMPLFEEAVAADIDPTFAAGLLESTLTELRRDSVPIENLSDEHLMSVMRAVESGQLAKEGVPTVLETIADTPTLSVEAAIEEAGLGGVSEAEVKAAVEDIVERNASQVEQEGMAAFSALMGEAMGALRGKADGEVVSTALRESIQQRMS